MYSFVIIHRSGQYPQKCTDAIRCNAGNASYEIIAVEDVDNCGKLGFLRNLGVNKAVGDIIITLDDDILIEKDFLPGIVELSQWINWLVCGCRVLNPDGSRHWDYKENNGCDWLVHYGNTSDHIVLTGGIVIANREVYDRVRWSDHIGFYQGEDLDFSRRLQEAGIRIDFNPYSTVTHDDDRYQRVGKGVVRK